MAPNTDMIIPAAAPSLYGPMNRPKKAVTCLDYFSQS